MISSEYSLETLLFTEKWKTDYFIFTEYLWITHEENEMKILLTWLAINAPVFHPSNTIGRCWKCPFNCSKKGKDTIRTAQRPSNKITRFLNKILLAAFIGSYFIHCIDTVTVNYLKDKEAEFILGFFFILSNCNLPMERKLFKCYFKGTCTLYFRTIQFYRRIKYWLS